MAIAAAARATMPREMTSARTRGLSDAFLDGAGSAAAGGRGARRLYRLAIEQRRRFDSSDVAMPVP
jgi:hypothetical protein